MWQEQFSGSEAVTDPGEGPGGPRHPLFLDQTEAKRFFFGDTPPPPSLPPPYLKALWSNTLHNVSVIC